MTLEVFEQRLTQLETKHDTDMAQLTSALIAMTEQHRQQATLLATLTVAVSILGRRL